jgi:hypothetical protein
MRESSSHTHESVSPKDAEAFQARLLAAIPALSDVAAAPDSETIIQLSCPNPKIPEGMVIWMEGTVPSLGFGPWHGHASNFRRKLEASWDGLIDFARAILDDQLVLVRDGGWLQVLDLRDEDALIELLTSKFCSGAVDVLTWSGSGDRRVGLDDL